MLGLLKIENIDIYITGNNLKFLCSEIMTEFRNRGDEIHIMPLTICNFILHKTDQIYITMSKWLTMFNTNVIMILKGMILCI